jgi:hypothetical protein
MILAEKETVEKVRRLVREEYEKGDGNVSLQIKHAEMVEKMAVEMARKIKKNLEPWEENLIRIEGLTHDVKKIAKERDPKLRLTIHGRDSADWVRRDMEIGLSPELKEQIAMDIEAHMGMPFVEQERAKTAEARQLYPKKYPDPANIYGLCTRVADYLSCVVVAGKNMTVDREAGCLDRYFWINLLYAKSVKEAYELSAAAVEENLQALENSQLPERLGQIEKQIARIYGPDIRQKFKLFSEFTAGKWPEGHLDRVDAMDVYYKLVSEFREQLIPNEKLETVWWQ